MSDEVGTEPMMDVPEPAPDRRRWACTECGNERVKVDPSKPSIDPRYALGSCDKCHPMRKTKSKIGVEVSRQKTAILRQVT